LGIEACPESAEADVAQGAGPPPPGRAVMIGRSSPRGGRGWAPRLAACPVADFAGLAAARRHRPVAVLDVRRRLEWSAGHIDGAMHVPLHRLPARLPDLPSGPIWVHCQAGYRASVAASMLHAAGHRVTAIDDDVARAAPAGLPVVSGPAAAAELSGSGRGGRA
jgi:hydroxyacylglutathione hydrolase